jgi:hypothetical protein
MDGILVGTDAIPIIDDTKADLQSRFRDLEGVDMADNFIHLNKHNPVTTTYYLLLKKTERETGKNLLFEKVTHEKRNYYSTGNLNANTRPSLGQTMMMFRGHSQ